MMNPSVSPAHPITFPLNQLMPHCHSLLRSINDDTSHEGRTILEQILWNEVKKVKNLNDPTFIFHYLIGYYHAVIFSISRVSSKTNDLLQYHLLIRLGDLNRYTNQIELAKYYYSNARNLFPQFGQAFNQLGLLTKPDECYKCCYYYTRAARSREKPLDIAESNLRIAVGKFECQILDHILNLDSSLDGDNKDSRQDGVKFDQLPETAIDWFYVIVVAIHADNIRPIVRLFLKYLSENFSNSYSPTKSGNTISPSSCHQDSFTLLASLDILLDWLRLGSQGDSIASQITTELRQLRSNLVSKANLLISNEKSSNPKSESKVSSTSNSNQNINTILNKNTTYIKTSNDNSSLVLAPFKSSPNHIRSSQLSQNNVVSTNSSPSANLSTVSTNSTESPALAHDYILRGFSPLTSVHQNLTFEVQPISPQNVLEQQPIELEDGDTDYQFSLGKDLVKIIERVKLKIDAFVPPILRRKTRNIALESILSNQMD